MSWGRIAYEIARQNPDVQIQESEQGVNRETSAPTEHDEQVAVFRWAAANEYRHPELRWLFAIPNGGHRHPAVAAKLKAEGVRAGLPDVALLCPKNGKSGLFIEIKRADHSNHTTPQQDEWITALQSFGYDVVIAYGADAAIQALEEYLSS